MADVFRRFFQYHGKCYFLRTPSQLTFSCSKWTVAGSQQLLQRVTNNNWFSTSRKEQSLQQRKQNKKLYGWGSTAPMLEPLRGGSLLFTTKLPEIPGTHFYSIPRTQSLLMITEFKWINVYSSWSHQKTICFLKPNDFREPGINESTYIA